MALDKTLVDQARSTFLAGRYNVLLGAGASNDSLGSNGEQLPLGGLLRDELIALRPNFRKTSTLSRIYNSLTKDEKEKHITKRLLGCSPGDSYVYLRQFFWKRIYTLNIDDAIDIAYESKDARQAPSILNHLSDYTDEKNPDQIQIVHVHGTVLKPNDGYIFSIPEYVKSLGPGSPWLDVLANTLITEPFIVAGTSLEETDIAYFLANRDYTSVRTDRGPSFLIEPYPDEGTLDDCKKYGLNLYEGTLAEFLREIDAAIPVRPMPIGAVRTVGEGLFNRAIEQRDLAIFSRDFSHLISKQEVEDNDLSFFAGREPQFRDVALSRDIPRSSNSKIADFLRQIIRNKDWQTNFVIASDIAGGGKTTTMLRCLYDLSSEGINVFRHESNSSLSTTVCANVFNSIKGPFIIFVDDFADHAPAIMSLYKGINRNDFLIIGCERGYRVEHAVRVLEGHSFRRITFDPFSTSDAGLLIQKMDDYGLTGSHSNVKRSSELKNESIATAVCRVMNDFRSIESIVDSLIKHADSSRIDRYVGVAIASYCYRVGLKYDIMLAAFDRRHIDDQMNNVNDVLPLSFSDVAEKDYAVPMNQTLGHQLMIQYARSNPNEFFDVYCRLGEYLAPYVNRAAIIKRAPEARIAGRLFDYDEAVSTLLKDRSEAFYVRMKKHWGWNSRYWEQQALLKLAEAERSGAGDGRSALAQSISHARHAVRVERHPHTLTTLGRILISEMKQNTGRRDLAFADAFKFLAEAIALEGRMSRVAIHPYGTMFRGLVEYIRLGGVLSEAQRRKLKPLVENASSLFSGDAEIMRNIGKVAGLV